MTTTSFSKNIYTLIFAALGESDDPRTVRSQEILCMCHPALMSEPLV